MTYKWEAMVEDLTVERDRLLKDNERLMKALEEIGQLVVTFAQDARAALNEKETK